MLRPITLALSLTAAAPALAVVGANISNADPAAEGLAVIEGSNCLATVLNERWLIAPGAVRVGPYSGGTFQPCVPDPAQPSALRIQLAGRALTAEEVVLHPTHAARMTNEVVHPLVMIRVREAIAPAGRTIRATAMRGPNAGQLTDLDLECVGRNGEAWSKGLMSIQYVYHYNSTADYSAWNDRIVYHQRRPRLSAAGDLGAPCYAGSGPGRELVALAYRFPHADASRDAKVFLLGLHGFLPWIQEVAGRMGPNQGGGAGGAAGAGGAGGAGEGAGGAGEGAGGAGEGAGGAGEGAGGSGGAGGGAGGTGGAGEGAGGAGGGAQAPFAHCGQTIQLRSSAGDYLHRPDSPQGVTTWHTGIGNRWQVECEGSIVRLKSWKNDALHRPDAPSGVTSWHTGHGNDWSVESVGEKIRLKSWKNDYLSRIEGPQGVDVAAAGPTTEWMVEPAVAEPPPPPVNLARGKATRQSSTGFGGAAARGADGNTNGVYNAGSVTHTNAVANSWWEVDLGSVQPIGRVVVFNRTDCCSERLNGAVVELSQKPCDATRDRQLTGYTALPAAAVPARTELTYPHAPQARYLCVRQPARQYLSIAELEAYAPVAPPVAVPDLAGTWQGGHPHWRDAVILNADGTYRRGNGDPGRWAYDGTTLLLNWQNWGTEILTRQPDGTFRAASNGFTLRR